jgi:hypothetical protein
MTSFCPNRSRDCERGERFSEVCVISLTAVAAQVRKHMRGPGLHPRRLLIRRARLFLYKRLILNNNSLKGTLALFARSNCLAYAKNVAWCLE